LLTLPILAVAQGRGGGGGGGGGGSSLPPTPFEEFVSRLKLSEKDQLPAVQRIFGETDAQARPVVQELTALRLRLLNLELSGSTGDVPAVLSQLTAAAAKMTAIEVQALGRVSGELKEGQLSRRREAFEVIGGMFYPPPPTPPRARRAGGPGGAR
jgi:hypothetical protein